MPSDTSPDHVGHPEEGDAMESSVSFGSGGLLAESRKSIRSFLVNAPSIRDLLASRTGTFTETHAILPSQATTGEEVSLTLQVWDEYERLMRNYDGEFAFETTDPDASIPDGAIVAPHDDGYVSIPEFEFRTPGIHYVEVTHPPSGVTTASNPIRVTEDEPATKVYWGDIHLHSKGSDGVGKMQKGLRFGREVMDLDVVSYTDHDTMGFFIPPSLQRWRMHHHFFDQTKDVVREFHDPGSFVTLLGYEWTKQPNHGGHINVYFDSVEGAELFDSRTPETETYEQLWQRLREWREQTGNDVVTIPHHPAEEMYPFDFSATDYDDELAPLVEIYSQWGSSERPGDEGNQKPIGGIAKGEIGESGFYVQDALRLGYRIGFLASSDFHGPFPGHSLLHVPSHLPRLSEFLTDGIGWGHIWRIWNEKSYPGGLVAFYAPELTREAIFESMRSRQVYGTTQPDRIIVEFEINGQGLHDTDSELTVPESDSPRDVEVMVAGTAPIERVDVVKNNQDWQHVRGTDDPDADLDAYTVRGSFSDDAPIEGMQWDEQRGTDADVYYVRAHQADGGAAWAGPLWVGVE